MNETTVQADFGTRCSKVLQVAKDLFQRNPDWVTFFREVLGVNGAARNVFQSNEEYLAFEQSPEYGQIQQMVANLRNRKIPGGGHNEPTRVITVRLPESLHEALKAEATDHRTSMNKLCISKLLQVLNDCENRQAGTTKRTPQPPAMNRPTGNVPPVPAPSQTIRSAAPPVPAPSVPVPAPSAPVPAPSSPAVSAPVPAPGVPVPAPSRGPVPSPSRQAHAQPTPQQPAPQPADNQDEPNQYGNRF